MMHFFPWICLWSFGAQQSQAAATVRKVKPHSTLHASKMQAISVDESGGFGEFTFTETIPQSVLHCDNRTANMEYISNCVVVAARNAGMGGDDIAITVANFSKNAGFSASEAVNAGLEAACTLVDATGLNISTWAAAAARDIDLSADELTDVVAHFVVHKASRDSVELAVHAAMSVENVTVDDIVNWTVTLGRRVNLSSIFVAEVVVKYAMRTSASDRSIVHAALVATAGMGNTTVEEISTVAIAGAIRVDLDGADLAALVAGFAHLHGGAQADAAVTAAMEAASNIETPTVASVSTWATAAASQVGLQANSALTVVRDFAVQKDMSSFDVVNASVAVAVSLGNATAETISNWTVTSAEGTGLDPASVARLVGTYVSGIGVAGGTAARVGLEAAGQVGHASAENISTWAVAVGRELGLQGDTVALVSVQFALQQSVPAYDAVNASLRAASQAGNVAVDHIPNLTVTLATEAGLTGENVSTLVAAITWEAGASKTDAVRMAVVAASTVENTSVDADHVSRWASVAAHEVGLSSEDVVQVTRDIARSLGLDVTQSDTAAEEAATDVNNHGNDGPAPPNPPGSTLAPPNPPDSSAALSNPQVPSLEASIPNGSACVPGHSSVHVLGRGTAEVATLYSNEHVLTGNGNHELVLGFLHMASARQKFVDYSSAQEFVRAGK